MNATAKSEMQNSKKGIEKNVTEWNAYANVNATLNSKKKTAIDRYA